MAARSQRKGFAITMIAARIAVEHRITVRGIEMKFMAKDTGAHPAGATPCVKNHRVAFAWLGPDRRHQPRIDHHVARWHLKADRRGQFHLSQQFPVDIREAVQGGWAIFLQFDAVEVAGIEIIADQRYYRLPGGVRCEGHQRMAALGQGGRRAILAVDPVEINRTGFIDQHKKRLAIG